MLHCVGDSATLDAGFLLHITQRLMCLYLYDPSLFQCFLFSTHVDLCSALWVDDVSWMYLRALLLTFYWTIQSMRGKKEAQCAVFGCNFQS